MSFFLGIQNKKREREGNKKALASHVWRQGNKGSRADFVKGLFLGPEVFQRLEPLIPTEERFLMKMILIASDVCPCTPYTKAVDNAHR